MLAATLPGGWTRPIVLLAAGAAFFSMMTSISFGPYLGLAIAGGTYVVLRYVSISRYVWGLFVSFAVVVMIGLTFYLAYHPVPDRTKKEGVGDSFLVRWEIVHKCWPLAEEAGPFSETGSRKSSKSIPRASLCSNSESVDNAYMLFYVVRGFIYAGLWAAIPICVGFRVAKAMRRTKQNEYLFPLAIGAGSSIGISFAFYFVWAGWNPEPYTMLWLIATAFTMSLCDACFEGIEAGAGRGGIRRAHAVARVGGLPAADGRPSISIPTCRPRPGLRNRVIVKTLHVQLPSYHLHRYGSVPGGGSSCASARWWHCIAGNIPTRWSIDRSR